MKHKQNEVFFITNSIGNMDNLVDLEDETPKTFETEKEALGEAKEVAKECGLRTFVYKCIPIFRVDRGKVRITKLSAKTGRRNDL
jgi:hypothetical protein